MKQKRKKKRPTLINCVRHSTLYVFCVMHIYIHIHTRKSEQKGNCPNNNLMIISNN